MFGAPSRYAPAASARYRDVDVAARVEGASPHGLVAILYEELIKAVDTLRASEAGRDRSRAGPAQARALSVLHGLVDGLDHARGGEVAATLAQVYARVRRLVMTPAGPDRAPALAEARATLAELATAWNGIG